ncbi:ankyrin repeat-containing domain protein [Pyronema domesticum]|nr:ankyrin repeat-containing domain protein [Pyronema domesticum]
MEATQILHIAVHFGLSGLVQYVVDNYEVDLGNEPFDGRHPPLLRVAMHGYEEVVRILIEKGADVNLEHKYNYTGLTSLCMAVTYGHEGVVRLLLDNGAEIDIGGDLCTHLSLAANYVREAIV